MSHYQAFIYLKSKIFLKFIFGFKYKIKDSAKEKELRANLKSEVQKLMSKEDIVILDSSNYIKGYRYELFCILKLCQTTQCVIFANTTFEDCLDYNSKRPDEEKYTNEV